MIRLTKVNGEAWYVNPDHIVSIGKHVNQEGNTYVETTVYDGDCIVTESPEEVARKVLEYRLAMERYRAYANAAALDEKPQANECWELAANARAKLVKLVGLEEPNHDEG